MKIELTKEQIKALAENLEFCLFDQIRNDQGIDNINWLIAQCETYKTLAEAAGIPIHMGDDE